MLEKYFTLRLFNEKDLPLVKRINKTCLPENYAGSFFLGIHYRFPNTFIVAEIEGELIGYIMFRIETGLSVVKRFTIAKKGHLISLAVLPKDRRLGIGQALLSRAITELPKYACECYLEVRVSNQAAIKLYEKLTFKIKREIKGYYRDGESAYLMALNLEEEKDN